MRDRFTRSRTLSMTEKMSEDVQAVADVLGTSFADVVRECVERELPRLKERYRKRKKARKA